MIRPDPLARLEQAYVLDYATSALRHNVRNKLASIRNMIFYLAQKAKRTSLWTEDARVPQFSSGIDSEVCAADNMIEEHAKRVKALYTRTTVRVSAQECLALAADALRANANDFSLLIDAEAADLEADRTEVALALRCILENAVEAMPTGGTIAISGRTIDRKYRFEICDVGPGFGSAEEALRPFFTTKDGRLGLGLNIANQIARGYGGDVVLGSSADGGRVTMTLHCPGDPTRENP